MESRPPIMCQDVTLSTQESINLPATANSQKSEAEIVAAISQMLKAEIGKSIFDLWFESPAVFECDGQQVSVFADSPFQQARLQSKFGQGLRKIVDRVAGPQYNIEFKTAPAAANETPERVPNSSVMSSGQTSCNVNRSGSTESSNDTSSIQQSEPSSLDQVDADPQKCFSFHVPSRVEKKKTTRSPGSELKLVRSFWFGDENRLARASVEQVFAHPGEFSPLMFYGSSGCGKSHILEATVNEFRRRLRMKRCIFMSSEQFTSQFVSSLRGGAGLPMFRKKYRDLDLLAIDDIQFFVNKKATLNEFLYTIDNLARLGKQVIVSSDRPPVELDGLGTDLAARLSGGLTCPLQYPGFDGRIRILENMCKVRNFRIPGNVMELIANYMTRDVRRISGAINRLYAVSKSLNEKVSMHLAQEVLGDLLAFNGVGTSLVGIEQAVCEFCGVKTSELRSKSRRKKVSAARMLAMYLSRQHTSSAFSEIGDHFGGRSHSTVIAAEKKVTSWIDTGESIQLPNADYPAKEVISRIESILRIG